MSELRLVKLELNLPVLSRLQDLLKVSKMPFERLVFRISFTAWRTDVTIVDEDREKLLSFFIANPSEHRVDKGLEDSWSLLRSKEQAPWEHDPSASYQRQELRGFLVHWNLMESPDAI